MKTDRITVRLDADVREALRIEAKKQGVEEAVMVRMFVRDGLARFDQAYERIVQNTDQIANRVDTLQKMIAATLHIVAEQVVLAKKQKDGEEPKEYAERLKSTYRESVFGAVTKGRSITAAVEDGQGD
mgnify:CR=1 FL=1